MNWQKKIDHSKTAHINTRDKGHYTEASCLAVVQHCLKVPLLF